MKSLQLEKNSSARVLIRVDCDDPELPNYIKNFAWMPYVKLICGARGDGYMDIHRMYYDLWSASESMWSFIFNDDCTIDGPWMDELIKVDWGKHIVQPEIIQNGGSTYKNYEGGPFPFVETHVLKLCPADWFNDSVDTSIDAIWRHSLGLTTHFLKGVTVFHDRQIDETLPK